MAISFTKDLETGISVIDEQHQELIDRINNLGACSKAETQKTIDLLSEYVVKHFADEEEMHNKYNYPDAEAHKVLHKNFISEFEKVTSSSREGNLKFAVELNQFIVTWIVKHIKAADVKFGEYYKQHCSGK